MDTNRCSGFAGSLLPAVLLLALVPASAVYGATFTVNSSADLVDAAPGDGICDADPVTPGDQCTLRAAIQQANALTGDDTIQFDSALDGIPLILTLANVDTCPPNGCFEENDAATGDLDILENLVIVGNGADKTIIQGGVDLTSSIDRVLEVTSGGAATVTLSISGVTIRFGKPTGGGQPGGAISLVSSRLTTITDSVISDNQAHLGGGIYIGNGDVILDRVTVARNTARFSGGGLHTFVWDTLLSITNSTFNDNTADDGAGGGKGGALNIGNETFTGVTPPTIFNSTLSGNIAADDGCATYHSDGQLRLYNVTVENNCTPGSGKAAIVAAPGEFAGRTVLRNSVLRSPAGVDNCRVIGRASLTSDGYNVSSDASCLLSNVGDVENTDPLLGPLANNGGPTPTHLPLPGSPAIDTGTPTDCPPTDQRGLGRPADGNGDSTAECDKGSVEVAAGGPGPSTGSIQGTKWNDANGDGVKQPGEAEVVGVQICLFPTSPSTCTATALNGAYQFSNVAPGTYHVYERLPAGRINTTPRSQEVNVSAGQTVTGVNFGNRVPSPPPSGIIDVNTAWQTSGTPVQPRGRALIVRATPACVAASATATFVDGAGTRTQAMTNVGGNTWETTFAPPFSGFSGHLTVNVSCADGTSEVFEGDILFVDPSGRILDSCTGNPLAGANVTLFKNEPFDSPTFVIPDPSEHIPTNNPEITAADGLYAWDVVPGRWRVEASKAGYNTVTTSSFDVPPPVLGLDITLTPLAGCNIPPVANNDVYSTDQDTTLNVPAPGVLANDTDADSDPLTALLVTNAGNGNVVLNADGSFTYTPNAGFHGTDSFTYKANDHRDDSNVATVTITVRQVNRPPVARDDAYRARKNKTLVVPAPGVLANDADPDSLAMTAVLVHGPTHGILVLNPDGSFIYKPKRGFVGKDTFTYRASDGINSSNTATVTINVTRKHEREKDDGEDDEDDDKDEHKERERRGGG